MTQPDYYAILQVHPQADREVIGAAYRRLAARYHPDVNGSSDAVERMRQLNAAYEVLSDPASRAAYDRGMRATLEGELIPGRSWRWLVLPVGLLLFAMMAPRLGIRATLVLLAVAVLMWLAARAWGYRQ